MRVKQFHMCCERLVLLTVGGIYRCDHLFLEEKLGKSGKYLILCFSKKKNVNSTINANLRIILDWSVLK